MTQQAKDNTCCRNKQQSNNQSEYREKQQVQKYFESKKSKQELTFYFGVVLCMGLMQYTTNYIFERMNVGYALALFQVSTLISVVLGVGFFHEEHFFKKVTGACIMMIGSVLILLF